MEAEEEEEEEMMPHPALGYPTIRVWEINNASSNSTRYQRFRSAPSDELLQQMWLGWSISFGFFALVNTIIFIAILVSSKTRQRAFNQYLLALMVPNIILVGLCSVTCATLSAHGGYYGGLCESQSFYLFWLINSNNYINMVIAYQLRQLLVCSAGRRRYFPPTPRTIIQQSIACYGLATLPSFLHYAVMQTDSNHGLFCMPLESDTSTTLLWWLLCWPIGMLLPLVYITRVTLFVQCNNLFPPSGKRREVVLLFGMLHVTFGIMWIPSLVAVFIVAPISPWYTYWFALWSHAVGAVSACLSCYKQDIRFAVLELLTCGKNNASTRTRSNNTTASHLYVGDPGSSSVGNTRNINNDKGGWQSSFFFIMKGRRQQQRESETTTSAGESAVGISKKNPATTAANTTQKQQEQQQQEPHKDDYDTTTTTTTKIEEGIITTTMDHHYYHEQRSTTAPLAEEDEYDDEDDDINNDHVEECKEHQQQKEQQKEEEKQEEEEEENNNRPSVTILQVPQGTLLLERQPSLDAFDSFCYG